MREKDLDLMLMWMKWSPSWKEKMKDSPRETKKDSDLVIELESMKQQLTDFGMVASTQLQNQNPILTELRWEVELEIVLGLDLANDLEHSKESDLEHSKESDLE